MTDVVIVGCGGHGREALLAIRAANEATASRLRVLGFVDDAPSPANLRRVQGLGLPHLGPIKWLAEAPATIHVVLGLGDPRVRREVGAEIDGYGLPAATVVHPAATLGPDLVAGEGLLVYAGARVTTNVTLGRHVHLNQNCTVGHDSTLGDHVSVYPLAAVSGDVRVGDGSLIGAGAVVLQGRRVGRYATVGAGACVVRDVPDGTVVKGVPAA